MRLLAVAALAAFFIALFGVASMPTQDGMTIFAYWYQRADSMIVALTLATVLMPIFLLAAVFTQEKDRSRWSFERLTMKRDIDQLMTVLKDLGAAQKGLGQGAYLIGKTDPAAEARKLAASVGEAEARLEAFERHLGDKAVLDGALKAAAERQVKLSERLANLQGRLGPTAAEMVRLTELQASLGAKLAELEKAGGVAKLTAALVGAEQFAERTAGTISALDDLRARTTSLMPRMQSLFERQAQLGDSKTGVGARAVALEQLVRETRGALNGVPDPSTIAERLQSAASEEPALSARIGELEKLLPRISAVRGTVHVLRARIPALSDESSGVRAVLSRVEATIQELKDETRALELDDEGNSVHDAIESLEGTRTDLERRVAQVEDRARRLVGLAGGLHEIGRKLNGAGADADA